MKNILVLLLLVLFCNDVSAQGIEAEVKFGENRSSALLAGPPVYLGSSEIGDYFLSFKGKGLVLGQLPVGTKAIPTIQLVDENFDQKRKLELTNLPLVILNKVKGKTFEFATMGADGAVHIFYSQYVGTTNKLYRKKLSPKTFKLVEETLVMSEENPTVNRGGSYWMVESPDKSKIGIISLDAKGEGEAVSAYVEVLDRSFKSQWQCFEDLDITKGNDQEVGAVLQNTRKRQFKTWTKTVLSNSGTLSHMSRITVEDLENKWGTDWVYRIYSFSNSESPAEITFANDEYQMVQATLISEDDELEFIGFFSTEEEWSKSGLFNHTLDAKTLSVKNTLKHTYSNEEILDLHIGVNNPPENIEKLKGQIRKKQAKKKGFFITDVFSVLVGEYKHDDGSITLVTEQVTTFSDGIKYGNLNFYNLKDGELRNFFSYYKRKLEYSVAGMAFHNDHIYATYYTLSQAKLKLVRFDKEGGFTEDVLFDAVENPVPDKLYFLSANLQAFKEGTFLTVAQNFRKIRMVELQLRD